MKFPSVISKVSIYLSTVYLSAYKCYQTFSLNFLSSPASASLPLDCFSGSVNQIKSSWFVKVLFHTMIRIALKYHVCVCVCVSTNVETEPAYTLGCTLGAVKGKAGYCLQHFALL